MSTLDRQYRPRGTNVFVQLLTPADRTESGIALPDSWKTNHEEGEVVAVGPGRQIPTRSGGFLTVMWVATGDRVFFQPHDLHWIDPRRRIVCLAQEDLIAIVRDDGTLRPLNEWCVLRPGEPEMPSATIALPQGLRKRKDCGRLLDCGPGPLVLDPQAGDIGTHRDLCVTMGLSEAVGRTVYFDQGAEVLAVGRGAIDVWCVRMTDLVVYEDAEPGQCDSESWGAVCAPSRNAVAEGEE